MIKLNSPLDGETIELLTGNQQKFLKSDRKDIKPENFDHLNLKKQDKDDWSFPREITFKWESVGESTIQISEKETFDEYYSKVAEQCCDFTNLKCGTRYFWRVVCGNEISDTFYFDTADKYPRFLKLEGLSNVRDCGGWKTETGERIKQGLLYRGCEMNSHIDITENGLKTMREMLKIKSVLDLRGSSEIVKDVYKENYINIPVNPYSYWFDDPETSRKVFEFLSDKNNYPIYFHCWGGADRTGTLAFLLGSLLGQKYDDLIDDYEATSISIWGVRSRNSKEHFQSFINDLNKLEGATLAEKTKTHFLSCGVTEAEIENFRKIMLS